METATQIMTEEVFADVLKRVSEKEFYYHATGQEFEIDAEKCAVSFNVDAEVDLEDYESVSFEIYSIWTCDESNNELELSEEQVLRLKKAVENNTQIDLN